MHFKTWLRMDTSGYTCAKVYTSLELFHLQTIHSLCLGKGVLFYQVRAMSAYLNHTKILNSKICEWVCTFIPTSLLNGFGWNLVFKFKIIKKKKKIYISKHYPAAGSNPHLLCARHDSTPCQKQALQPDPARNVTKYFVFV